MSLATKLLSRGLTQQESGSDPYWNNVVLLFQPDVSSSTFQDLSNSNHTLTGAGSAALTSTVTDPWGGSRKVLDLDGSNANYIYAADSTDWEIGSGDWTIEMFVRFNNAGAATDGYIGQRNLTTHWEIVHEGFYDRDTMYASTGGVNFSSDAYTTNNTWIHLSWSYDGTTYRVFRDGVLKGSQATSNVVNNPAANLTIGLATWYGTFRGFNGRITGVRITKGVARYTSNFTIPSIPFPTN